MEARRLMSVAPGWSTEVAGLGLSYEASDPNVPASAGHLTVTGTPGDDVVRLAKDPAAEGRLLLELNGATYGIDLSDLTNSLGRVVVNGGAGNDRLVSEIPFDFCDTKYTYATGDGGSNTVVRWDVELNGGDGNDALFGGTTFHALRGDAGDDLLVGGDGRNFMDGGDGDDTLFGHGYALDGHGADPTYDIMVGGAGNDVVHGGAMGWANADDANDLVFQGLAPSTLRVNGPNWGQEPASYTAGDALLAGAAGATAKVVDGVLVITGTSADDQVELRGDTSGKLTVTVNGSATTFDRAAVRRYLFDARGGHDRVSVVGDLVGWAVRTPSASDGVDVHVEQTVAAESTGVTEGTAVKRAPTRRAVLAAKRKARAARRTAFAMLTWVPQAGIFSQKRIAKANARLADVLGG
jgi:Ca2+-binding RTX toxin-like protein